MTPHTFPFTIAYADTDAGGIVYHGRYIEIAERARMDWLGDIRFADGDIGFVITRLDIKYIKPLRLFDRFVVETVVVGTRAVAMNIEQKFVKDGEVYAILNLTAAYLDSDMRPKAIPEDICAALKL